MSLQDDILRERRLTDAEARALVERAKAKGWLSVRTDEAAAPARFHGKMAYVPRAKRREALPVRIADMPVGPAIFPHGAGDPQFGELRTINFTGAPRRVVRQVAVSVPTSGVPVPIADPTDPPR